MAAFTASWRAFLVMVLFFGLRLSCCFRSSVEVLMLVFFVPLLFFSLLLSCSVTLKPLPSWVNEIRLVFFLLLQEFICFVIQWLKDLVGVVLIIRELRDVAKVADEKRHESKEEMEGMTLLDLPDLPLECILEKLAPAGLCNMACVCSSLKDWCTSDHLWARHMRDKWGRVLGKEWQWYLASRGVSLGGKKENGKQKAWIGSFCFPWPFSLCRRSKIETCGGNKIHACSTLSWYSALESGRIWFPAQVYNRESGHVGFMLSCYDAELSYDRHKGTFFARYPPHGKRHKIIEEGVNWDRIRLSPVDTAAHELHISNCLNDLRPGDHIEIQWRRSKEFPYGWWYGVVGHLESCDGNEHYCRCEIHDTFILEFKQYALGSRWRQVTINRNNHHEEGSETNGFYGGIRKLQSNEEISRWKQMWPSMAFE